MANTKSAIKRIRRIVTQTRVNKARKSKYRNANKKMNILIEEKKKSEALVQASMKLGEAIYKAQQNTKPEPGKDDGKDNKDKKDDNVVDADFEEVKEDKKDGNQEKSA